MLWRSLRRRDVEVVATSGLSGCELDENRTPGGGSLVSAVTAMEGGGTVRGKEVEAGRVGHRDHCSAGV